MGDPRKVEMVRVPREEEYYDREAVLGRDATSVFPREAVAPARGHGRGARRAQVHFRDRARGHQGVPGHAPPPTPPPPPRTPKAQHKASETAQQAQHAADRGHTQGAHTAGEAQTGIGAKVDEMKHRAQAEIDKARAS